MSSTRGAPSSSRSKQDKDYADARGGDAELQHAWTMVGQPERYPAPGTQELKDLADPRNRCHLMSETNCTSRANHRAPGGAHPLAAQTVILSWSNRAAGSNTTYARCWSLVLAYARRWGYWARLLTKQQLKPLAFWAPPEPRGATGDLPYEKWWGVAQALEEFKVVLALDDDAFINDETTPIAHWLDAMSKAGKEILMPVQSQYKRQSETINVGAVLVRSTERTRSLFSSFRERCAMGVHVPPLPAAIAAGSLSADVCGGSCHDQHCFNRLLLSNASVRAFTSIVPSADYACHPAHFSYTGVCDPWVLHTLGWTKHFFLDATVTQRLSAGAKLQPQQVWEIAVAHNPPYSRALGWPQYRIPTRPPSLVPRSKGDGCASVTYSRLVACLDAPRLSAAAPDRPRKRERISAVVAQPHHHLQHGHRRNQTRRRNQSTPHPKARTISSP